MSTSIYQVLDELRGSATSEADKGSKLERLVARYLRTDPVYADQFSEVYLWQDWPGRGGKHDTGIDLVAVDRLSGGQVAIQCKFFAPHSTVSKPDIDSFLSASGKAGFSERIIVSTTEKWNPHAEDAIQGQQIPVRRIGVADLEASVVDWDAFSWTAPEVLPVTPKKRLRPHQLEAVEAVRRGLDTGDRGKLVMACGTGKTFTSLRLAEQVAGPGRSVLFLVPSISLLSQTLREWATEAEVRLAPVAVCSDRKATARSQALNEDISAVDLALPSTTDVAVLESRLTQALGETESMAVVFATYQSIDVVARAQKQGQLAQFDLIICDEAHRTTGTTMSGEDESAFVRIHNDDYLRGRKRVYMTATPRIYDDSSKARAGEENVVLTSMDDESLYGPELHRLGFGEAVARELLADYKVLVLAVDETAIAQTFQMQLSEDGELRLDDAAKIVGCWNGLAKRGSAEHSFDADPGPMRRAVAFAGTIKDSQHVQAVFADTVAEYAAAHNLEDTEGDPVLRCEIEHVDGSYNALERNRLLDWLRDDIPDATCRILTNARCLSEGVDVPALDAVMFLSPRKSVVDIVQSVGRVMRKAPGKDFGYIILPIGIPAGVTPEAALRDNKRYAAVWEVLQALRAHDERFNAMINRIDLTSSRDDKINVIGIPESSQRGDGDTKEQQPSLGLTFAALDEWREAIYAKIVAKVGSRKYWEQWAKDVADIAQRHITRITALLDGGDLTVTAEFDKFLDGLRANLNEGITRVDAIEMLAQHLITRPVFDALFGGYDFAAHNPVAQTMERMLAALDEHALDNENQSLEKFYESVRMRVDGVDTAEGRQKLILQLYDTFFATAFKKTVDKLGIVYTPVEIVDFILRSADEVLRQHFDQGLSDEGVHILDGFAGTGTFIVRLLQSGLIKPEDLVRKYSSELHANEILLLAYYIAAVNIESTFIDISGAPKPFEGLVLTDTFQSWEDGDRLDAVVFADNNARLERLKALPITVILGNPPYSSGQDSANDNNQNAEYPGLDASVRAAYSSERGRGGNNSLYDSYIRALRWATLRVQDRGIVSFVINGGFIDANAAAQMRRSLSEDFTHIHIYNLRGNGRIGGEAGRKEGRPLFEFGGWRADGSEIKNSRGGSRATIAIVLLVKDQRRAGPATVTYAEVADYLSAGQKIRAVSAAGSFLGLESVTLLPNRDSDWLNQRSLGFQDHLPLGAKHGDDLGKSTVFSTYSRGLETGRDAWIYNSNRKQLERNIETTVGAFNSQVAQFSVHLAKIPSIRPVKLVRDFIDLNPQRISWTLSLKNRLAARRLLDFDATRIRSATYRPFMRQWAYIEKGLNHIQGQIPHLFPAAKVGNVGIYYVGAGSDVPFSVIMVDSVPDLHVTGAGSGGQFFPRWRYENHGGLADTLNIESAASTGMVDGHKRLDNITDASLTAFQSAYGPAISKDDIFFYIYGLLHSPDYRERYFADLKKMLPRVPLVTDPTPYIDAGRRLSAMHLRYEEAECFPLDGLDAPAPEGEAAYAHFYVDKMSMPKVRDQDTKKLSADRSRIVYNSRLTLSGIPEDAYRYLIGSRSAIEWIIDRYQVRTDKSSGIVNDPNDWCREVSNPRYILDLIARIVTVSIDTMQIVDALPPLELPPTSA